MSSPGVFRNQKKSFYNSENKNVISHPGSVTRMTSSHNMRTGPSMSKMSVNLMSNSALTQFTSQNWHNTGASGFKTTSNFDLSKKRQIYTRQK